MNKRCWIRTEIDFSSPHWDSWTGWTWPSISASLQTSYKPRRKLCILVPLATAFRDLHRKIRLIIYNEMHSLAGDSCRSSSNKEPCGYGVTEKTASTVRKETVEMPDGLKALRLHSARSSSLFAAFGLVQFLAPPVPSACGASLICTQYA